MPPLLFPNLENYYIEFGARKDGVFRRNMMFRLADGALDSARALYDNCDVHATAYLYSELDQNSADLIGPLYFDLDNPALKDPACDMASEFEKVRADTVRLLATLDAIFHVPQQEAHVYFSGQKGFHLIIPYQIFGAAPRPDLNNIYKEMAQQYTRHLIYNTADLKIYDRRRMIRLPNSIHPKTSLYKIPLDCYELRRLSLQEILSMAGQPRELTYQGPNYNIHSNSIYRAFVNNYDDMARKRAAKADPLEGALEYIPPCIVRIETEGLKLGQRNNTLAALSSFYKQHGLTEGQTLANARIINARSPVPSESNEIELTVKSIYSYQNKRYGCAAIRDLGYCMPGDCRFGRGRI